MSIYPEVIPSESPDGNKAVNTVPAKLIWRYIALLLSIILLLIFLFIKIVNLIVPPILIFIGIFYLFKSFFLEKALSFKS